jgi:cellulose synthase/poly-beta-1,6-N-acetylglucosamine synthase-like glycosyltransferase
VRGPSSAWREANSGKRMADSPVSVIVPTYDRAYCLERTPDSVLTQTHCNPGVIVVDDVSTDATEELVSTISHRERRVHFGPPRITVCVCFTSAGAGVVLEANTTLPLRQPKYVPMISSGIPRC